MLDLTGLVLSRQARAPASTQRLRQLFIRWREEIILPAGGSRTECVLRRDLLRWLLNAMPASERAFYRHLPRRLLLATDPAQLDEWVEPITATIRWARWPTNRYRLIAVRPTPELVAVADGAAPSPTGAFLWPLREVAELERWLEAVGARKAAMSDDGGELMAEVPALPLPPAPPFAVVRDAGFDVTAYDFDTQAWLADVQWFLDLPHFVWDVGYASR